ncbi:glycosyl hydrolase family 47 [Ancylostoma ceylanicum]|uniref:alpha-1,2-Mannosidase n=1 Tax=Ancylostoma ceylanicum TaxID=53326 RepID=A0A0D6LCA7_9BILA|nr:glycosyl hydrolase family 47 [Ancylostoma ceylanicum]
MQTVRLNRAAVAASAAVLFILLCVITYLPSSSQNPHVVRAIRPNPKFEIHGGRRSQEDSFSSFQLKNSTKKKNNEQLNNEIQEKDDENGMSRYFLTTPHRPMPVLPELRKKKVVEMMLHAWNGYKNYSWGENELRPVSKTFNTQAIFGGRGMPATIVDAADTLWIMGLRKEYEQARDYIKENFDMNKATGTLSVFETTIRFLGGLLSLFALTGEQFYISSILAEFGSLHLEFTYLSHIAKAPIFAKKVKKIRDVLDRAEKVNGLYSNYINSDTGKFTRSYHMSLGALGDSFYEYLIKSWLQSGKTDEQARKMYWEVSKAIQEQMVLKSKSGLTYVAELRNGLPEHKMGHLACFSVGMFALQAVNEKTEEERLSTMRLAEELGRTCHESYIRTTTHIGPEMFYFNGEEDATSRNSENGYILRPEVIEGFFYLWRLTGKPMYREWVWDAIQAIDKYCRVEGGFSGIYDVYDPKKGHDDVQQSFFLAETLKYAYLTFTDNSVVPLDKWVFNTEAHPLPVMS